MVGAALPAAMCSSVSASAKCQQSALNCEKESVSASGSSAAAAADVRQGCTGGDVGDSPWVWLSPLIRRMLE